MTDLSNLTNEVNRLEAITAAIVAAIGSGSVIQPAVDALTLRVKASVDAFETALAPSTP